MIHSRQSIARFILLFVFSVTIAPFCVSSHAYEISEESRKLVDGVIKTGPVGYDCAPDQVFPPGSIPLDAIDYLIGFVVSDNMEIDRSCLILLIENIYESNREALKDYGLDGLLIQFIEKQEKKEQIDSTTYSNISDCLRLLAKIRSAKAVQFLRSRIDLKYWDGISVKEYDTQSSRLVNDNWKYRRLQREKTIHMLCLILDATAEIFLNELDFSENDPDYNNIKNAKSSHRFMSQREKILQQHSGVTDEKSRNVYDHLYKAYIDLRVYHLEHKDYPTQLNQVPLFHKLSNDVFRPDQPYSYQKTEKGFRLWSVGKNGKTDQAGAADFDDLVVEYW